MTKATGAVAALLLGTCISSTVASAQGFSKPSTDEQLEVEALSVEYDRLRLSGIVTDDLAEILVRQACNSNPAPGVASLMRLAARHWRDSAVSPDLSHTYADCLVSQVQAASDLGIVGLEVLPQLPGEPGLDVALALLRDEEAPPRLRAKAAKTFMIRTSPLPQTDLVQLLERTTNEEIYSAAAYALRRSNDPEVVVPLVREVNRFWNPAARLTLEARIDLVRKAAESSDLEIRQAAAYALRRLTTAKSAPGNAQEAD